MGAKNGSQKQARNRSNTAVKSDYYSDRRSATGRDRESYGTRQQIDADYQDCLGGNSIRLKLVTGGILNQLIQTVQNQLEDTEACLDWYKRKKADYETQLEALQSLAEMIDQDSGDSSTDKTKPEKK